MTQKAVTCSALRFTRMWKGKHAMHTNHAIEMNNMVGEASDTPPCCL